MLSRSEEMAYLGDTNGPANTCRPTSSTSSVQDEELLVRDESTQNSERFQPINTLWVSVLQFALLLVQVIVSCLFLTIFDLDHLPVYTSSLIIYIQAGLWSVFLVFDYLLHLQHMTFRRRGYLYFYKATRNLRRASFIIISAVTVVLLVLLGVLHDLEIEVDVVNSSFRPDIYLVAVVGVQMLASGSCIIVYAVKVAKFNRRRPLPDILEDEILSPFLQTQHNSEEIGFRGGHFNEDIIEKQADMIRYLQQHNANLGRKLLKYTTTLSDSLTYSQQRSE